MILKHFNLKSVSVMQALLLTMLSSQDFPECPLFYPVACCSAYRPHPDRPSEFYKIMHERTELQFDWQKKLNEYIGTVIRSNRGSCRMRQTVCPTMYLTKGTLVILKMVSGWVSRSDSSSGVDRGHRRMWNNCVVLVLEIWGHFLSSLSQRPLEATSIFSFAMPLSIYHSLREKIGRAITRVEFQVSILH